MIINLKKILKGEMIMMAAVKGHYDGTQIIMDESVNLREGQEVIVMILDLEKKDKEKIDLKKYMGRGEKMFQTDAQDYVKGMRADDRIS